MDKQDPLYTVQLQLAEAYFQKIRGALPDLDHSRRVSLLYSLDKLVENYSPERQAAIKAVFDYEEARKTRESLEMTRKKAVSEVGGGLSEITLFKYETGRLIPRPSTESGKRYLSWLEKAKKRVA